MTGLTAFLDCFDYKTEIRQSARRLWEYWRTTTNERKRILKIIDDVEKALTKFKDLKPVVPTPVQIEEAVDGIFCLSTHDELKRLLAASGYQSANQQRPDLILYGENNFDDILNSCIRNGLPAVFEPLEESASFESQENPESFFMYLASQGATPAIDYVLSQCDQRPASCDKTYALRQRVRNGDSPLTKAISEGHADTVQAILNHVIRGSQLQKDLYNANKLCVALANAAENDIQILQHVLKSGIDFDKADFFGRIVLLEKGELLLRFLQAEQANGNDLRAVCTLKNVEKLIEGGKILWQKCAEFWHEHSSEGLFCPHIFDQTTAQNNIVHMAVKAQRVDVVQTLLLDFPNLANSRDDDDRHPLLHLCTPRNGVEERNVGEDVIQIRKDMWDLIIYGLIRSGDIEDVYESVADCQSEDDDQNNVELRTILFDFTSFRNINANFDSLLTRLPAEDKLVKPVQGMHCERTLHTLKFPDLDHSGQTLRNDHQAKHTEIWDALQWLRKNLGVQQIKTLVVPDRKHAPHDWDVVHTCVWSFSIRSLNWRCVNLCLSDLAQDEDFQILTGKPGLADIDNDTLLSKRPRRNRIDGVHLQHSMETIEHLHLYTDGNENTLQQWCGTWGIGSLINLKDLQIDVLNDMMSQNKAEMTQRRLRRKLDNLKASLGRSWRCNVDISSWTSPAPLRPSGSTTQNISPVRELVPFLKRYPDIMQNFGTRRTKVVIIDSGLMRINHEDDSNQHGRACRQVQGGRSFLHGDSTRGHLWHLAGESWHGTQMACIISSLDPMCDLYVAQVCDDRIPLTTKAVRKAIRWATEDVNADIISLSLSLNRSTQKEENMFDGTVVNATNKDVVLIHSTMDEGHNRTAEETAFYTHRSRLFAIAACDSFGVPLPRASHEQYSFRLLGRLPTLSDLDYLQAPSHQEGREGSSIATAMATGLASLVISCTRIALADAGRTTNPDTHWRSSSVRTRFSDMWDNKDSRYVSGKKFFGDRQIRDNMHDADAMELIRFQLKV